jgi:hypothetical protein
MSVAATSHRSHRHDRGEERGSVLLATLALASVLAVAIAATVPRTVGLVLLSEATVHRDRAHLAAETALAATLVELTTRLGDRPLGSGSTHPSLVAHERRIIADDEMGPTEASVSVTTRRHGELVIAATGYSSGQERTIRAVVRVPLMSDLLRLTDVEVLDPVGTGVAPSTCLVRRPQGGPPADCTPVVLTDLDRFDGPVHSNDAFVAHGAPDIRSTFTSAWLVTNGDGEPSSGLWPDGMEPTWAGPFGLRSAPMVLFPTEPLTAPWDPMPTCRFRGPTLLRLDGTMVRVTSPLSVPAADAPGGAPDGPFGCPGLDRTLLAQATAIELPEEAVIEIVPADPATCAVHPLGLADDEDGSREWSCAGGDAFVWGRYLGRRTVAAQGDVQIVWDVERGTAAIALPEQEDATLALVARGSVVVRRLVGPPLRVTAPLGRTLPHGGEGQAPFGGYPHDAPAAVPTRWEAPRIEAAIVALGGSLRVQNVRRGQEGAGPLLILGSLAQRFPGPVHHHELTTTGESAGRSGYELELRYDQRLRRQPPLGIPVLDPGRVTILDLHEVAP